jgi:hypothetical protein
MRQMCANVLCSREFYFSFASTENITVCLHKWIGYCETRRKARTERLYVTDAVAQTTQGQEATTIEHLIALLQL